MKFARWKILKAIHEKADAPMGFREIQRSAKVGTDNLVNELQYLTQNHYLARTSVGAYARYKITQQGKEHEESLCDMISIEEIFKHKPLTMRMPPSSKRNGPSGTLLYKNISFAELQSVFIPAWEKLVQEVSKQLEGRNCDIGFVGTIKRHEKSNSAAKRRV
jgi:DNA-binding HxlR family transcriptional regulator